jgi:hypothetical protein
MDKTIAKGKSDKIKKDMEEKAWQKEYDRKQKSYWTKGHSGSRDGGKVD